MLTSCEIIECNPNFKQKLTESDLIDLAKNQRVKGSSLADLAGITLARETSSQGKLYSVLIAKYGSQSMTLYQANWYVIKYQLLLCNNSHQAFLIPESQACHTGWDIILLRRVIDGLKIHEGKADHALQFSR